VRHGYGYGLSPAGTPLGPMKPGVPAFPTWPGGPGGPDKPGSPFLPGIPVTENTRMLVVTKVRSQHQKK
jgi:hypothetical protein